jgi:hypothetical protein
VKAARTTWHEGCRHTDPGADDFSPACLTKIALPAREPRGLIIGQSLACQSIRVIPNWSDGVLIVPIAAAQNKLRKSWVLNSRFVVGYAANLGRAHDVATIIEAVTLLHERATDSPAADIARRRGTEILREYNITVSPDGRPLNPDTIDWVRANVRQLFICSAPRPEECLGESEIQLPQHARRLHARHPRNRSHSSQGDGRSATGAYASSSPKPSPPFF